MAVQITGWIFAFCAVLVECQITSSPTAKELCTGSDVDLDWIYGDAANIATVTWTYIDSSSVETTIMQQVTSGSASPVNNYNVVHKTNGGITLTNVTLSNSGSYKITVSYLSATPQADATVSVTVNDAPTGLSYTDVGSVVTCSATTLGSPAAQLYLKVDGTDTSLTSDTIEGSGKAVECCLKGDSIECMTTSPCVTVRSSPDPYKCPGLGEHKATDTKTKCGFAWFGIVCSILICLFIIVIIVMNNGKIWAKIRNRAAMEDKRPEEQSMTETKTDV